MMQSGKKVVYQRRKTGSRHAKKQLAASLEQQKATPPPSPLLKLRAIAESSPTRLPDPSEKERLSLLKKRTVSDRLQDEIQTPKKVGTTRESDEKENIPDNQRSTRRLAKLHPPPSTTKSLNAVPQTFYALGRSTQTSITNFTRRPSSSPSSYPHSFSLSYYSSLYSKFGKEEGFKNLGNTCYMNAILQAVLSFDCFVADLQANSLVLEPLLSSSTSFCSLLLGVAKKMRQTNHGVIDLKLLKNTIDKNLKTFAGWSQQDAHEFFGSCLTGLEEELAKLKDDVNKIEAQQQVQEEEKGKSATTIEITEEEEKEKEMERKVIMESLKLSNLPFFSELTCPTILNFGCVVRHEYMCDSCNRASFVNEPYRELSLEVALRSGRSSQTTPSITSLLKAFFMDEEVDRTCHRCLAKKAKASHRFLQLPRILVIHLKRFKTNPETKSVDKISQNVKIDKELNLEFACNRYTFNPQKGKEYKVDEKTQGSRQQKGKEHTTPKKPPASPLPSKRQKIMSSVEEKSRQLKIEETAPSPRRPYSSLFSNPSPVEDLEDVFADTETPTQKAIRLSKKEYEKHQEKKKEEAKEVFAFDSQGDSPELAKVMKLSMESFEKEETERKEREQLELALAQSMQEEMNWEALLQENGGEGPAAEEKQEQDISEVVQKNEELPRRRFGKRKRQTSALDSFTSRGRDNDMVMDELLEVGIDNILQNSPRHATLLFNDDELEEGGDVPEEPDEPFNSHYQLRCIVLHKGKAAAAGHYVTDVFDPVQTTWENFNDSRVTEVTESTVLGEEREQNGYLLFYIHGASAV